MSKISTRPCPICKVEMFITGKTTKGESLTSCGHKFSFRRSRSQKDMDRKYVKTENGYELAKQSYLSCSHPGCPNPVSKNSNYCLDHKKELSA